MEILLKCLYLFTYFSYGMFGGLIFHRLNITIRRFFLYFFFLFLFCYVPGIYGLILLSFLNIILFKGDYFSSLLLSVVINSIQLVVKLIVYFILDNYFEVIYSSSSFHLDQFYFQLLSLFIACIILMVFKRIVVKGMSGFTSYVILFICTSFQLSYLAINCLPIHWFALLFILGLTYEYYLKDRVLIMERDNIINDRINLDYRKEIHENTNHLLLIKSMDYKEDIKTYVDHLLGNKNCNSKYWMKELNYLHFPGIKEFLNFKLNELYNMGASIELFISDDLDNIYDINMSSFYDLTTILGILIDNIKDCIMNMDSKLVSIQFYLDDDILHWEFVNGIEKDVDVNSIFRKGYSTKGKNRGVGLSIVSDIISRNPSINCCPRVIDNFFLMDVSFKLHTKNH